MKHFNFKPKSLEILRKLFFDYILQFSGIPFSYPASKHTIDTVHKFNLNDSELQRMTNITALRSEMAIKSYSELVLF